MKVSLKEEVPELAEGVWLAPSADIVGRVRLGQDFSVWFGAVLRGDNEVIQIGRGSNVQDGVVIHVDPGFPCIVGENCVIGHRAVLHGCQIGNEVLVGIGAIVLNGAVIPEGCLIGAGALVPEGKVLEPNSLYVGVPARKVRTLSEDGHEAIRRNARGYRERAARYRAEMALD